MEILETPGFRRDTKRLHPNQRADLVAALKAIEENPSLGQQKSGDLAWLRVHKFRMASQLVLLGYEVISPDRVILHALGSHENFYRDIKG